MNTKDIVSPAAKIAARLTRAQVARVGTGGNGGFDAHIIWNCLTGREGDRTLNALERLGLIEWRKNQYGIFAYLNVEGQKVWFFLNPMALSMMHEFGARDEAARIINEAETASTARSLANLINQTAELLPREVAQRELIEHCPAGWALAQRIVNGEVSGAVVRYSQDWWLLDETADIASALLAGRAEGQIERAYGEAIEMNRVGTVIETISADSFLEISTALHANDRLAALELIWSLAPEVSRAFLLDFAHGEAIKQHAEMFPAGDPVTVDVDGAHHVLMIALPDQAARPVLFGEVVTDAVGDSFRVEGAIWTSGGRPTIEGRWQRIAGEVVEYPALSSLGVADASGLFPYLEFVSENA